MKKLTHRALSALLALTLALSLAVPALAVEPVRVTGVSLSRTEAVLAPGETLTLNAAVAPANATVPDVLWDSSRPGVATVKDGAVTAEIRWSSSNYDFMVVDGEQLQPETTEGGSLFLVPVAYFDRALPVQADTTAMGSPHLIDYTLRFDSATLEKAE